jgi:protein-arginine kinase activator protein McsA
MEVITRAESKAARGNTARDPDLTALRNQLAQAIEREEYERAAVIRDRIKRMEKDQKENEKPE